MKLDDESLPAPIRSLAEMSWLIMIVLLPLTGSDQKGAILESKILSYYISHARDYLPRKIWREKDKLC